MQIFKNWIKLFFISFMVSITSIIGFNFFVDSAGVFSNKSYLAKASEELLSGKMIAGLSDYDERLFHSLIIKKQKQKVDSIVLGSSRAMVIRKKFIVNKNKVFFNHAVSGASLEDYIAIVDLYEQEKGYIPKYIMIGVDPWVFNKFNGQSRWRTLKDNYFDLLSKLMKKNVNNSFSINSIKWKQLINYEYTLSNILFLKKNFGRTPYYITSTVDIEDSTRALDASLYYPFSDRTPNKQLVEKLAIKFVKKGQVYSLEKFVKLDNLSEFENFINYLQHKGSIVTFILFPYNPISYNILIKDKDYAIIQDVEVYLKHFVKEKAIKVFGSYSPNKFNFQSKDFTDGMHGLECVTEKILKEYRRN